jgi:hypothetical protein
MKTKVSYLLLLCFSLAITTVNASGKKDPIGVRPSALCTGVQPFFYGFTYFPGQRVVYAGGLYQAFSTNSGEFPGFGGSWIYLGFCS